MNTLILDRKKKTVVDDAARHVIGENLYMSNIIFQYLKKYIVN